MAVNTVLTKGHDFILEVHLHKSKFPALRKKKQFYFIPELRRAKTRLYTRWETWLKYYPAPLLMASTINCLKVRAHKNPWQNLREQQQQQKKKKIMALGKIKAGCLE